MARQSYILGIDIGTGSTKAAGIASDGAVLFSTSVTYPTLQPQPGLSEQAPELIWQAFVKCIQRTIQPLGQPDAVAFSSAMHSLLAVDDSGQPLMNMITWADNRSAAIAIRIKNSSLGEVLYEQTGTPIHSMSPICKIVWLREHQPALFEKAAKFISIKEFIWHKLFNEYEVDYSIASATGMFDIEKLCWNTNALHITQLDTGKLSTPVNTTFKRSSINSIVSTLLGVGTNVPFVIGSSDGCLANLGSGAIEHGVGALTIGTSGALRVAASKPTLNFKAMIFNYRLDEEIYISGGPVNNGGVAFRWYIQNLLGRTIEKDEDYDTLLDAMAKIPAGANGLMFLPYLLGDRAPIWNSAARGTFFGVGAYHTQAHFTRAVIEGICMALFDVGKAMDAGGLEIKQLNVSGGFTKSNAWVQIVADMFNKKVGVVNAADASALGATYLAKKSIGRISSFNDIDSAVEATIVPKDAHHKTYGHQYQLYKQIYEKLEPLFEQG